MSFSAASLAENTFAFAIFNMFSASFLVFSISNWESLRALSKAVLACNSAFSNFFLASPFALLIILLAIFLASSIALLFFSSVSIVACSKFCCCKATLALISDKSCSASRAARSNFSSARVSALWIISFSFSAISFSKTVWRSL